MQRKRTINNKTGDVWISGGASNDDDGGSAKRKTSNKRGSSKNIISSSISSDCLHELCLPDVPVALKLVILSFVGFALLVVLTAKGRHAHWRYKNAWNMRAPHMPTFQATTITTTTQVKIAVNQNLTRKRVEKRSLYLYRVITF